MNVSFSWGLNVLGSMEDCELVVDERISDLSKQLMLVGTPVAVKGNRSFFCVVLLGTSNQESS